MVITSFVIKVYHMEIKAKPTPLQLKKVEETLDRFDKHLQSGAVFNEPLSSSERAILKTLLLWLELNKSLDVCN